MEVEMAGFGCDALVAVIIPDLQVERSPSVRVRIGSNRLVHQKEVDSRLVSTHHTTSEPGRQSGGGQYG
jgi:hypothetical protein